ncbi:MAG: TIR domain-containing protein [Bacteroidaceae bacterium]|nr:TIR domain-containing protein [Bacteroidaceae bacterium]
MTNKFDIFISYSRKDFDEVNQFVEMLKERIPSLTCWFDITGIDGGDEFDDKIISAIDNSSYMLFALSDHSLESKWTRDEVMYAKNTGKKVIPLLLKGAQLKGFFLFKFGRIDCIDTTISLQVDKLVKNLTDWTGKAMAIASRSRNNTQTEKEYITHSKIQTIYYSDGKKQYEGEIQNGKYHGQGTYYFTDGGKYVGQFKNGAFNGQGTFYYADGDRYEGQFENNERHGLGTFHFTDGSKYVGQFKDGAFNGQGTLYFVNGDRYEGQFENNKYHGQGFFYYANGDKQKISYNKGELIQQSL